MTKLNNNRADRGPNKKTGNDKRTLTIEEQRTLKAKQLRLKPKTKAFVDELLKDPKLSHTEAYLRTHKTTNRTTAGTGANKLLKQPNVIGYRDSAVRKAKLRIISLVDSDNESVALKASESIIDRNEGKAIQKSESLNRTVEVKLDLTGARLGAHYVNAQIEPGVDVV